MWYVLTFVVGVVVGVAGTLAIFTRGQAGPGWHPPARN